MALTKELAIPIPPPTIDIGSTDMFFRLYTKLMNFILYLL